MPWAGPALPSKCNFWIILGSCICSFSSPGNKKPRPGHGWEALLFLSLPLFLHTQSWPLPVSDLLCCNKKKPPKTKHPQKIVPCASYGFVPFVSRTRLATGSVWVVENDFVAVNYCRAGGQQPLSEASFLEHVKIYGQLQQVLSTLLCVGPAHCTAHESIWA